LFRLLLPCVKIKCNDLLDDLNSILFLLSDNESSNAAAHDGIGAQIALGEIGNVHRSAAAKRRTEQQLKAMEQTLRDMDRALQQGQRCEVLDAQFHEQLAQASGNRALVTSAYSEVINRSIHLTQHMDDVQPEALEDHEKILAAATAKDTRAAEQSMRQHLNNAQKNLKKARQ